MAWLLLLMFALASDVASAWPTGPRSASSLASTDTSTTTTTVTVYIGRSRHLRSPNGLWSAWVEGRSVSSYAKQAESAQPSPTSSPSTAPSTPTTDPLELDARGDADAMRIWNCGWRYDETDAAPGETPPGTKCYLSHVWVERRGRKPFLLASVGRDDYTTEATNDLKLIAWSPDSKRLLAHWNFQRQLHDGPLRALVEIHVTRKATVAPVIVDEIAPSGKVGAVSLALDATTEALLEKYELEYGDFQCVPSLVLGYAKSGGILIDFFRPDEGKPTSTRERWLVDRRRGIVRKVSRNTRPVSARRAR